MCNYEGFISLTPTISICLGNSLSVLKVIESDSIDAVLTDPPYFIDGMGNNWDANDITNRINKASAMPSLPIGMKFDAQQGKNLQDFVEKISKEVYRILKPGGFYLSFAQPRLYHRMAIGLENCGFEIRDMLIWKREGQVKAKAFTVEHFVRKMNVSEQDKKQIITSIGGRKTPQLKGTFEPIVLAQKPKDGTFVQNWMKYGVGLVDTSVSLDGKFPSTIMDIPKPIGNERCESNHPTMKPITLMSHLIKLFTKENDIICDPFLGSGSTAIACYYNNRRFLGVELNESYFSNAKERILKHVHMKKPKKLF